MSMFYIIFEFLFDLFLKNLILIICVKSLWVIFESLQSKNINPNGRAVLITGCASGFGYELALRLNKIGFKVYATVRSIERPGAQLLMTNAVFPNKMIVYQMNTCNEKEVNEVFENVRNDLNNSGDQLWALVNNAGVFVSSLLEWGTIDNYYNLFETNVFGTVRVTRIFLPLIKESEGRIIIINSVLGRTALKGIGIYSMSKHALVAFSDTLRRELSKFNVKCSSIEPGLFKTQMTGLDKILKDLEDNWDQSSDEVKKSYRNLEYNTILLKKITKFLSEAQDINIVIEDIVHSIINYSPKIVYRPMAGWKARILLTTLIYLPDSLVDYLVKLFE